MRCQQALGFIVSLDSTWTGVICVIFRAGLGLVLQQLADVGVRVPEFYAGDLFCPPGTTPLYLGQPVALLVFNSFDDYDRTRVAIRDGNYLMFGSETGPVAGPNYGAFRFTRVSGSSPDAPDVYSPVQEGWISPGFVGSNGRPIWQVLPDAKGPEYVKGALHGAAIRDDLAKPDASVLVLDRASETQSIDPMFLEPEAGMGYFEPKSGVLETVLGVQPPFEAASAIATLLGEAGADFKPARIEGQFCYVGGGFGGRDHTPFPLYVTLAAMFLPGRAVRLAHDRFQQFQGGIKRHAFKIRNQIAVDRASGQITAFAADHVLDGGGLMNCSVSVAVVAATGAVGMYAVPKVDVTTVAEPTRGVTAGSMRGYGTVQCLTALETLIDEVCASLKLDPIEFRRRNALKVGGQAEAEAARMTFQFGLWPAALALWGIEASGPCTRRSDDAYWQDGMLILAGLSPLPLEAVAAKTHQQRGMTGHRFQSLPVTAAMIKGVLA